MDISYSKFQTLMHDEFGAAYAHSLEKDFVLVDCGGFAASEAYKEGYGLDEIWFALCEALDVPEERRLGKLPQAKK